MFTKNFKYLEPCMVMDYHYRYNQFVTSPTKAVCMATDGNGQDRNGEHWQVLYSAALQEVSIDTLPRRIQDAEQEIAAEMKRSNGVRDGHQALLDALSALRDLQQISQAFPVYASDKS